MRSLSKPVTVWSTKVIKADMLTISIPLCLQNSDYIPEVSNAEAAADDLLEESGAVDLRTAEQEAAKIIAETEDMVKELLAVAREQAEQRLEQARSEAEGLLDAAREDVSAIIQQAKEQGYQEGYSAGLAAARNEADAIRSEAAKILAVAEEEKSRLIAAAELDIAKLSMLVAEKIIREELTLRQELVGNMVRAALDRITGEEITVKVNPLDLEYVLGLRDELRRGHQGVRNLKVVADEIISQGECVLETANGSVDGRVDRQLDAIREALMDVS